MSRLNVASTKSVQLRLKKELAMFTEGYNLLEQKREILVMELMRLLNRVKVTQAELDARRKEAYDTLRMAIAQNGFQHMNNIASGIHYDHEIRLNVKVSAGVRTPVVEAKHGQFRSQFGFVNTDSLVDRTMKDFLLLLEQIAALAELETTVMKLARELKKTQHRVNALEHIFIPDYKETLHYIGGSLESKEQESFFTMKMVKTRANAKLENGDD